MCGHSSIGTSIGSSIVTVKWTPKPTKAGEFAHQFIEKARKVFIRGSSRSYHSNNVSLMQRFVLNNEEQSIFDLLEVKYIGSFMGTISSAGVKSLLIPVDITGLY